MKRRSRPTRLLGIWAAGFLASCRGSVTPAAEEASAGAQLEASDPERSEEPAASDDPERLAKLAEDEHGESASPQVDADADADVDADAEDDADADDDDDDADPRGFEPDDVDSVAHVKRVMLPKSARAGLGTDHLGLDNVFWAKNFDERLVVETIYADDAEFQALMVGVEEAERAGRPPKPVRTHPALVTFSPGETLQVVGPDGPHTWGLEGFSVAYGASEGYLLAYFGKQSRRVSTALVLRTERVHPGAALRSPSGRRADAALLASARGWVGTDPVGARLKASHVTSMPIGGPKGAGRLVAVSVRLDVENPDEEDYPGHWSGLVVEGAGGERHAVMEPKRRLHEVQVVGLADLDGDGIDAIVFHTDDVHSGYTYLAVWDGKAYRSLRLTGSGG